MKKLLVVFPDFDTIHLKKDVGIIPILLSAKYECSILCYKGNEINYEPSKESLKFIFLKKRTGIATLDVILYLLFNSGKYNILNCYHLSRMTIIISWVFSIMNFLLLKKRIIYVKLDIGMNPNQVYNYDNFIGRILLKNIELFSVENKTSYESFKKLKIFRNIIYIPNGYIYDGLEEIEKEKIILTVGRIGTEVKDNLTLLKAFTEFHEMIISEGIDFEWKLKFVGPVEKSFNIVIEDFQKNNPNIFRYIDFTGNISDNIKLRSEYCRSHIFVLSSISEGFPLVFPEAMSAGCTIVSTKFLSAYDVTNNGEYGRLFNVKDYIELAKILYDLSKNIEYLKSNSQKIKKYANENFFWPDIVQKLELELESLYV